MDVRFESSDTTLRSLYRWLLDERELRVAATIHPVREPGAGEMSGTLDAVLAILSTGTAIGQLVLAVAAWREAKRPRSPVTVVVHGGDPTALRQLLGALGHPSESVDNAAGPPAEDKGEDESSSSSRAEPSSPPDPGRDER